MSTRARYSRWDGTQVGFDLDADALLEEMTDDLLYHGDLNAALRRMMQQGFQDRQGRDVQGMREMLERLRERRREQLDRYLDRLETQTGLKSNRGMLARRALEVFLQTHAHEVYKP